MCRAQIGAPLAVQIGQQGGRGLVQVNGAAAIGGGAGGGVKARPSRRIRHLFGITTGDTGQAQAQDMAFGRHKLRPQRGQNGLQRVGSGRTTVLRQHQRPRGHPDDATPQTRHGLGAQAGGGHGLARPLQHHKPHLPADPPGGGAAIGQALLKAQIAKPRRHGGPVGGQDKAQGDHSRDRIQLRHRGRGRPPVTLRSRGASFRNQRR